MAMQATLTRDRAEDQFDNWYRCHHGAQWNYCTRFLRDGATAADVTQEALLRAWTRRDQFESESQVRPWLFRVARNLCIDTIRSRSKVVPSDSLPDRAGEGDAATHQPEVAHQPDPIQRLGQAAHGLDGGPAPLLLVTPAPAGLEQQRQEDDDEEHDFDQAAA